MSNYKEINFAINYLKKNGLNKKKISILYCVSSYPTLTDEICLPEISNLIKKFKLTVGISDHSLGIEAALGSIFYGGTIIEKHLTLNRKLIGPDHAASTEPKMFSSMVKSIRKIEKMINKNKINNQKINKFYVRKSIVASKHIKKGDIFQESNITIKRPQLGLKSENILKILGKKSKYNFSINDLIKVK